MSKNFAVISGKSVVNVIVANTKEDAELVTGALCVEYTEKNPATIGWFYDSEKGLFIDPVAFSESQPKAPTELGVDDGIY